MKVQVQRAELIDDFWRDGLLLDSTYLRALVVDGVTPRDAAERLKRLQSEKQQCLTSRSRGISTGDRTEIAMVCLR